MQKDYFKIFPAEGISGEIKPDGSKNLLLQAIWLVLLTKDDVVINNIPDIKDKRVAFDILTGMGVKISQNSETSFTFNSREASGDFLLTEEFSKKVKEIRASVTMMGACVSRFGFFRLIVPGGDKIGSRPIDAHKQGMLELGAIFKQLDDDLIDVRSKKNSLFGKKIFQVYPSVTATASTIMASVNAIGTTEIYNAACEPYIYELCNFLIEMGADIKGHGSNKILINGVKKLNGCTISILPDMIEVASFISLAHLVKKDLVIKDAFYKDSFNELGLLISSFKLMGLNLTISGKDIVIKEQKKYITRNPNQYFVDGPWPQFCPDWMSPMIVFSTQVKGKVLWHQHMFEDRLYFSDNLKHMGCSVELLNRRELLVMGNGKFRLKARNLTSPDIRAGIAMIIAALSSDDISTIFNINQIDRGYSNIEKRLEKIGAKIERKKI